MRTQVVKLLMALVISSYAGAQTVQNKPIELRNVDTTCAACSNFFQFANGGWIARNPVPAAYSRWGTFEELGESNEIALKKILELSAKQHGKIGNYYAACMDTVTAEARGYEPLKPYLNEINSIKTNAEIIPVFVSMHKRGIPVGFRFAITPDAKNSTIWIAQMLQAGLGLPDRDFYTNPGAILIRASYEQYVTNMFKLIGASDSLAKVDAIRVISLERQLAEGTSSRVERRDPIKTYNKVSVGTWKSYFAEIGRADIDVVNLESVPFFTKLDSLIKTLPVEDWKAYLRFHTLHAGASMLSKAFVDEQFRMNQKISGEKEQLPRVKKCIRAVDANLGEELGKAYVAEYFTPAAKARALSMVHNLEAAFRERIKALPWMTDSTRSAALVKLDAIFEKIGYPDKWQDRSALQISGSYFDMVMQIRNFEFARNLSKVGKPVDKLEWSASPTNVNAFYNPQQNQIIFPAAILQPPFFDPNADDAVNYGAIGAVIGHEMTHGFDDKGRQYDAHGNLRNWWSDVDATQFKERSGVVINQFGTYKVLDTLSVNGNLTLGENLADLGGLSIAYDALQRALKGKPRPALIDGFTPEQRFFLAWAQMWRSTITPEALRLRLLTDTHSPAVWRTNGPLSNMPEFAKAWGCKQGDAMVREERAIVW